MTHRSPLSLVFLAGIGLIALSTAACTTNPFEPTTDTVSSTSGKTWFTEDGLIKAEHKPMVFVVFNRENLRRDMAAGHGEYLTSISELLGVAPERRTAFFSDLQARVPDMTEASARPELLLATLRETALPYLP